MKIVITMAVMVAFAAGMLLLSRSRNPKPAPNLKNPSPTAESLRQVSHQIITGDWQRAEVLWHEMKAGINSNDTNMMQLWLNIQTDIVDGTSGNGQRLLVRKLAFQELYFHPWHAAAHRDWVKRKVEANEFSDPDMSGQATQLLKDIDRFAPPTTTNPASAATTIDQ